MGLGKHSSNHRIERLRADLVTGRNQGYSLGMESSRSHIQSVPKEGGDPGVSGAVSPSVDPAPFLSALREAADHESHKEDLVGGKTRGMVTVAGAYFAIVQTATFSASGTLGKLEGGGRSWTIWLAVGAIALLALALTFAVIQQWPRKHKALPSKKIGQDLTDLLNGKQTQRDAVYQLAKRYAEVTKSRLKANNQRLGMYYATAVFAILAVIVTTTELAVSLISRI